MKELARRSLGPAALLAFLGTMVLGLVVTPRDEVQGNLARLLYIHPAEAWIALYVGFGSATIASILYLWPRTRSAGMDVAAEASVEVSLIFILLTLLTGSLWGRPAWGVWWVWDARLTSTAVLGVLALGYLALRRATDDPQLRARRSAVMAILSAVNVPIVHFSVLWWKTLHQGATVFNPGLKLKVHGIMAETMLLSFVAFTLVFAWLVRERYRFGMTRVQRQDEVLAEAVANRQQEGIHS
ncbi:MAG: cytochrome c biogenesis protein CcsA [Actinomycetota bacterium]